MELLERDQELAALAALVDGAAARRGGVALLEGPPGAGKTSLLEAAAARAAGAGATVLVARASELEHGFAFGVARQLLERPVASRPPAERDALLAGAARHAAPVLDLAGPDAGAGAGDPHVAAHGLYWLVAHLADRAPLMLAVDDAQWADEASVRALAYLGRRVAELPVAVVVAARRGGVPDALAAVATWRGEPASLSEEAVGRLLATELAREPNPGLTRACRRLTGGNPFLVDELAGELRLRAVRPGAAGVADAERALPERVGEVTRRRLARLGPDATALMRALAVLGDGSDLLLTASLAGVMPGAATEAAAELTAADLIDDDHPLRVRHPLLRAAVEAATPSLWRAAAHGRAARLLAERGAPDGLVAAHLAASAPGAADPWAVERLCAAARAAREQGAPVEAAALLRRALAEPPAPELRAGLLRELGDAELAALRPGAAQALREALSLVDDPLERAETALRLAVAAYYGGDHAGAVDVLLEAIDELGDAPRTREQALRLEAFLGIAGRYDLGTEARTRGRVARVAAGLRGATPGERLVRSVAALESPSTAAELVEAARLGEAADGERPWPDPAEGAGTVAMYVHGGRPDLARALAERLRAEAWAAGSPLRNATSLSCAGLVALDTGDLRAAVADLGSAVETIAELRAGTLGPTLGYLALALAESGGADEADALLAAHGLHGDLPAQMLLNPLLYGRAAVRAARRRFDEAARDLLELGARHELWGIVRPSPPWRSAAALALVAAGADPGAPGGPRELAARELEVATAWGGPKGIAIAARAVALVEGGDATAERLAQALALLDGTPWRLERARLRADLGAALRRAGRRREAREELMRAMDEAHACGAEPLAELAAQESRASGARPRRHAITGAGSLTPSELRVAELVAAGRTNREVAHELFVTLATVETHLTRVYRKLGIPGRSGLAAALAAGASG